MRRCKNCGIECIGADSSCPLCGAPLESVDGSSYAYPAYRIEKHLARKILALVSLSAMLIMAFVNYFSWSEAPHAWALDASIGILLVWAFCSIWIDRKKSLGAKLFISTVILLSAAVYVDAMLGFEAWSTSYVIPISSSAFTIVLTILTMTGRKRYPNFFSYMTISFLIALINPLLYLFSLAKIKWLSMLPPLCAVLCLLTLVIIRKKDIKGELRKRFRL